MGDALNKSKITDLGDLEARTDGLDGWTLEGDAITRTWVFTDFLTAVRFINDMAPHAEELDHHPELFTVYDRVEVKLTTHDAGGLTDYDFALAARLDEVAAGLAQK
jgi:4a-hydroxytetrahydrobiopterin dehydratase